MIKKTVDLPLQTSIFDQLKDKEPDYVTITIGGNDVLLD